MTKEMHRRFIAQRIEMLTGLMKCGYINAEDPKDYLEWCQQIVAGLYTGYLYTLGLEEPDSKKETLIAQTFTNVMLRGLLDLINTKVPDKAELEYIERDMAALNEAFDDEFLPEVDDGK